MRAEFHDTRHERAVWRTRKQWRTYLRYHNRALSKELRKGPEYSVNKERGNTSRNLRWQCMCFIHLNISHDLYDALSETNDKKDAHNGMNAFNQD
jgi:hypothetical protein